MDTLLPDVNFVIGTILTLFLVTHIYAVFFCHPGVPLFAKGWTIEFVLNLLCPSEALA